MLWQEAGRSIGEYNVSRTMAKSERVKFIAAATTTRISKVTRYAVNIVAIYLGGNYMHLEICFMVIPRLRQCLAFATYSFSTSVLRGLKCRETRQGREAALEELA